MKKILILMMMIVMSCENLENQNKENRKNKENVVKVKRKTKNKTNPIDVLNSTNLILEITEFDANDSIISEYNIAGNNHFTIYSDDEIEVFSDEVYYDKYEKKIVLGQYTEREKIAFYDDLGLNNMTIHNKSSYNFVIEGSMNYLVYGIDSISQTFILNKNDSIVIDGSEFSLFSDKVKFVEKFLNNKLEIEDIENHQIEENLSSENTTINLNAMSIDIDFTADKIENGYARILVSIENLKPYLKVQNKSVNYTLKFPVISKVNNSISVNEYYFADHSILNDLIEVKGSYSIKIQIWGADISGNFLSHWGTISTNLTID